jgi:hypothetical protein
MTVLCVPFSAEFLCPDACLSRSLSSVSILRFQVRSAPAPVGLRYRYKAAVFLRACWFTRSARRYDRKKTIQSP